MAIPSAGCFHYTTVISERSAGAWRGRAQPAADDSRHPGLAGNQPEIALVDGVVTLTRTESKSSLRNNPHYERFWAPSPLVRFRIGEALERVVRPGDTLSVFRFGTGDLGATLLREGRLLIGLGSIGGSPAPHVIIEEDPRAQEVILYDIARALDDPEVTVFWLDVADPDLETKIQAFEESRAPRQVVALAGRDEDGRQMLTDRLFGGSARDRPWRRQLRTEYVDPRFRTQQEWTDYLRSLPKSRPTDLWIRFTIDGASMELREREDTFLAPWYLAVDSVYRPGCPGDLSQIGMAHDHASLTREVFLDSVEAIASRRIEINK